MVSTEQPVVCSVETATAGGGLNDVSLLCHDICSLASVQGVEHHQAHCIPEKLKVSNEACGVRYRIGWIGELLVVWCSGLVFSGHWEFP